MKTWKKVVEVLLRNFDNVYTLIHAIQISRAPNIKIKQFLDDVIIYVTFVHSAYFIHVIDRKVRNRFYLSIFIELDYIDYIDYMIKELYSTLEFLSKVRNLEEADKKLHLKSVMVLSRYRFLYETKINENNEFVIKCDFHDVLNFVITLPLQG